MGKSKFLGQGKANASCEMRSGERQNGQLTIMNGDRANLRGDTFPVIANSRLPGESKKLLAKKVSSQPSPLARLGVRFGALYLPQCP